MSAKINISIPAPCHENWLDMTVADKGRFCASCQKHVIDFTTASDRQIAEVFKKDSNVCGRFLPSQLQRDLIIPKEKNSLWMAASAAMVAFLGLGNADVFAQTEKPEIVQVEKDKKLDTANYIKGNRAITGIVLDKAGLALPGANINLVGTDEKTQTDFDGKFFLEAKTGDTIEFSFIGMMPNNLIVNEKKDYTITMTDYATGEVSVYRPTFFGRIIHSIGNIFR